MINLEDEKDQLLADQANLLEVYLNDNLLLKMENKWWIYKYIEMVCNCVHLKYYW